MKESWYKRITGHYVRRKAERRTLREIVIKKEQIRQQQEVW